MDMIDIVLTGVSGILSYLVGSFGSTQWYHPGVEEILGKWKLMFSFIAAGSVFISKSRRGLVAMGLLGLVAAIGFAVNYKSFNAIPPILSATDTSWFCFQLAQSCWVGFGLRLLTELSGFRPKPSK
jgi:hypothetical protein